MKYGIVVDSCCDWKEEDRGLKNLYRVPLTLMVDDEVITDDDTFDQKSFLKKMAASKECPHSACPAPQAYLDAYTTIGEVDLIVVVTLSSKLSGSYNSAVVAKQMYEEEKCGCAIIEVIDSESAASAETMIARKAMELLESDRKIPEIIEELHQFRDELITVFTLENIDVMRKNGRMSRVTSLVVNALSVKLVLLGVKGEITKLTQGIGMRMALNKMIDYFVKEIKDSEKKTLGITHCNCLERALEVRDAILKKKVFRDVYIVNAGGVSSMYENQGGIIVTA